MSENPSANAIGNTFVWHELYVKDSAAAKAFYGEVLGWTNSDMDMGEMGTYTMLHKDGVPVAGIMQMDGPHFDGVPPHWAVYVSVDDVDAKVEKAVSLGATILVPAMDIPGIGRMCLIQDTQGATVWLFKGSSG